LIKFPEHGYPAWVLDHPGEHQVHRYSTCRGFWGETEEEDLTPDQINDQLAADAQDDNATDDDAGELEEPPPTIRQRVAECGTTSAVLWISEAVDELTGELSVGKVFVCRLDEPFGRIVDRLHRETESKRRIMISRSELRWTISGRRGHAGTNETGGDSHFSVTARTLAAHATYLLGRDRNLFFVSAQDFACEPIGPE
jgi:hypothetical protein